MTESESLAHKALNDLVANDDLPAFEDDAFVHGFMMGYEQGRKDELKKSLDLAEAAYEGWNLSGPEETRVALSFVVFHLRKRMGKKEL